MLPKSVSGFALVLVAFGLGACSTDSTAPVNGELSDAEFDAMVEALGAVGSFAFDFDAPSSAFGAPLLALGETHRLAAETFFFTFSESVPCPEGGALDLAGSVNADFNPATGAGTYAIQVDQIHRSCAGTAPDSGKRFVFNGSPKITSQLSFSVNGEGELTSLQGSQAGGIHWAVDDKEGTCTMDVTYQVTGAQSSSPMVSVQGTLCGRTFEFQYQG